MKISRLSIFNHINGRQVVSLWASKIFERSGVKRLFGLNLVAAVFVMGVISPEADNVINQYALATKTQVTPIAAEPHTQTTFETPLADFRISQSFSFWHPGLDMTSPEGTPVYAIEWGFVAEVGTSLLGYGKHVVLSHERHIDSLYAHLSDIRVKVGQKIDRGELIGKVGSTGWSTGNHLHLEIHQNGIPVNPLELLPVKPEEIKYDGAYGTPASQPASLSTK